MRAAGFCGSCELCCQDSAFNRKYHSFRRLRKQPVPSGKIDLGVYMCSEPSSGQPGTCVISTAIQQLGGSLQGRMRAQLLSQALWDSLDCSPPGSSVQEVIGCMGCHFLLQGIFLTRGSRLRAQCLLHRQADSLPRSHQASPVWWSRS